MGYYLFFSYDDKKSFDHIEMWLNNLKENISNDENIVMALVGNKCDVENKEIDKNLIEDLKNRIGTDIYSKTSGKENIGIEVLFNKLVEKLYNQNKKTSGKNQNHLKLEENKEKKCLCFVKGAV